MAWVSEGYDFNPYSLQAQPREPQSTLKQKAGRKKRSSILCQVHGCGAELIDEKTYFKRYRICPHHCNIPSIIADGKRLRFCQQCGRFHHLTEFDDNRKSCRRKLKLHNERRRVQNATETSARDGDGAEGSTRAGLSSPDTTNVNDASPDNASNDDVSVRVVKDPSVLMSRRHCPPAVLNQRGASAEGTVDSAAELLKEFLSAERASFDFGFTTDRRPTADGAGVGQPEARNLSQFCQSESGNAGSYRVPASGNDQYRIDPAMSINHEIQLLNLSLHYESPSDLGNGIDELFLLPEDPSLVLGSKSADAPAVMVESTTMSNGCASNSGFHVGVEAPKNSQLERILSFNSALKSERARQHERFEVQRTMEATTFVGHTPSAVRSIDPLKDDASLLSQFRSPALGYGARDEQLMRISIKAFNCTPDKLLPVVRDELEGLIRMEYSSLEGYIRPGCVHLTVDVRGKPSDSFRTGNLGNAVERMLANVEEGTIDDMTIQYQEELVLVKARQVVAVIDLSKSRNVLPRISAVHPLAVTSNSHPSRTPIILAGELLADEDFMVICRQGGYNLTVELPEEVLLREGADDVLCTNVLGLRPGVAELEVQRGALLSASKPMLVLPDSAAVAEIRQLESIVCQRRRGNASVTASIHGHAMDATEFDVDGFLRDMGFVVAYLHRATAAEEGLPVPEYTHDRVQGIQTLACRLVVSAAARGWVATARMLLPATTAAGQSRVDAAMSMNSMCPSFSTLLHVAVGTGNISLVRELVDWCRGSGEGSSASPDGFAPWAVDAKGPAGWTPLHVAAVLPHHLCASMREELEVLSPRARKLWGMIASDDGATPEALTIMIQGGKGVELSIMATSPGQGEPSTVLPVLKINHSDGSQKGKLSYMDILMEEVSRVQSSLFYGLNDPDREARVVGTLLVVGLGIFTLVTNLLILI